MESSGKISYQRAPQFPRVTLFLSSRAAFFCIFVVLIYLQIVGKSLVGAEFRGGLPVPCGELSTYPCRRRRPIPSPYSTKVISKNCTSCEIYWMSCSRGRGPSKGRLPCHRAALWRKAAFLFVFCREPRTMLLILCGRHYLRHLNISRGGERPEACRITSQRWRIKSAELDKLKPI